jgi:hypothetical protein
LFHLTPISVVVLRRKKVLKQQQIINHSGHLTYSSNKDSDHLIAGHPDKRSIFEPNFRVPIFS